MSVSSDHLLLCMLNCCEEYGYVFAMYIDGLVQDCSNSIVNGHKLRQSCAKPSISCLDIGMLQVIEIRPQG